MIIVLDTNVWLSALFWEGMSAQIIEIAEDKKFNLDIFASKEILFEINKVINREAKFQKFLGGKKENMELLFAKILDLAELVEPTEKLDVVKADPDDNKILEAALASNADYAISHDRHLTGLKEFEGVKIITPPEFLVIWKGLLPNERLRKVR